MGLDGQLTKILESLTFDGPINNDFSRTKQEEFVRDWSRTFLTGLLITIFLGPNKMFVQDWFRYGATTGARRRLFRLGPRGQLAIVVRSA